MVFAIVVECDISTRPEIVTMSSRICHVVQVTPSFGEKLVKNLAFRPGFVVGVQKSSPICSKLPHEVVLRSAQIDL